MGDDEPGVWQPEFPGQRPPFEPGNELALQHGAFPPRRVDPIASGLVEAMLADLDAAYLQAPRFRPALLAWARAEAQCRLLDAYLAGKAEAAGDGVGDLGDERVKSAFLLLHRAEARALSGRKALAWTRWLRHGLAATVRPRRSTWLASWPSWAHWPRRGRRRR